jgi:hypothetical protein
MRVVPLLFALLLSSGTALAQEPRTQVAQEPRTQPATQAPPLNLPISLDKIREGLSQPAPLEPLKGLTADASTFRVDITEQQKFDELLAKIKFENPGPQVAGGIYAYDQFQRLFPRIDNPRVQPYAAFSTGEIITLGIEGLVEKYVAEKMAHVVGTALREQAEREAREEVARSLAAYWAARSPAVGTLAPDAVSPATTVTSQQP